jgi:hypothetical protein
MKSSIQLVSLIAIFAGCSVAPMNTATTARTLGTDNNQVTGSFPVVGVKYERGINDRFDLGVGLESQMGTVAHVFGKYSIENKGEKGVSSAAIFGAGYGTGAGDSKSAYLGPIVSYRDDVFEVFGVYKISYVHWDFAGLSSDDKDDLISVPSSESNFVYHEMDFGISIVQEKWLATVGGKVFFFPDSTSSTPFVDVAYKF